MRLHALNMKFMQYTKNPNHSMSKHLRVMSSMIRDLKNARVDLTDELLVLVMIHSFPDPQWSQMKF